MTSRARLGHRVRRLVVACGLVAAAPAPSALVDGASAARALAPNGLLGAQPAPNAGARRGWTAVRVTKWALLGATVGLGYYALKQSTRADRAYSDLRHLCVATPTACTLDAGRYPDQQAEVLYATSLRHDRRAQTGILGGQLTLLGSAALFVYDLRNGRTPGNIPFPGVPARLSVTPPMASDAAHPPRPFAPGGSPPPFARGGER